MKKHFLILLVIFVLAFFLRSYKLGENPPGLYWDEVSIGYNAYSILKTGQDEHGKSLPLTFKAFGEYKLPVYIYATVPSIAIFDLSEVAVRFPSALAGTLTVLLLYFLVMELFASQRLSLLSAFFLAISPWHLQFSRAAFEANLALFFLVLATLLFLKSQKHPILLLPSSFIFSLTFYIYPTARFFTPFLALVLIILRWKNLWLAKRTRLFLTIFLSIFTLSYLVIFLFPHYAARFTVVSAFHGYPPSEWPIIFFKNYLSYFSFDFLFFQGDQIGRHNLKDFGNLYFFEIPLFLIGFYQLINQRYKIAKAFVVFWLFLAPIPAALTDPSPHSLRSLPMVIPLTLTSSLGLWQIIDWLKGHLKNKVWLWASYGFIICTILYFFLNYLHFYWRHYPKISGLAWQEGNREMAQEVLSRAKNYDQILISDFLKQTYLYLLFYGRIDPNFYRANRTQGGFLKYHFIAGQWPPKPKGKTLWVISFGDKFALPGKFLKEVKIGSGDIIYRLWETE